MERLNLPTYSFKLKSEKGRNLIFDEIRKKFIVLTPEEWVRQHFIQFLIIERSYPPSLMVLEKQFKHNRMVKRTDILIYSTSGKPVLMVECKAPDVGIKQETFDQIAMYNLKFNVPYLVVTNGLQHYCCKLDHKSGNYRFLDSIPGFGEINHPG